MSNHLALLSTQGEFPSELTAAISKCGEITRHDDVASLRAAAQPDPPRAVVVDLAGEAAAAPAPTRFFAELSEAAGDAPIYVLLAADCPPRVRKLAQRTADAALPAGCNPQRLVELLSRNASPAAELERLVSETPHRQLEGETRRLITFSPDMFRMIDEFEVAARHDVTILLIGETGSGKTFLARLLHELSPRRGENFCTVACGALPPDLIESELFGYVKGAFTGADGDKAGKFAAAGRGTLLLDEIDVLPLEQQAKLLRVIETGEYEPVGSNETRQSRARLVVASNYNLQELVQAGSFRTDLFYRLNILNFQLPPLRHRPRDVEYLLRKFALDHSREYGITLREIDRSFIDALRRYPWPGNIREMENVIRRAVLYCQRGVLSVDDLPSSVRTAITEDSTGGSQYGPAAAAVQAPPQPQPRPTGRGVRTGRSWYAPQLAGGETIPRTQTPPMPAADPWHQPSPPPGTSELALATEGATTLEAKVDILERGIIQDTLARNHHRRKETAKELGISRVTLYNKMKKFGLLD